MLGEAAMWSMLGTQKGAPVASAARSAASRHSAVHRPHVPRAGAERHLQARPAGGCLRTFRRALRPAARLTAALHQRLGRPQGCPPRGAVPGEGCGAQDQLAEAQCWCWVRCPCLPACQAWTLPACRRSTSRFWRAWASTRPAFWTPPPLLVSWDMPRRLLLH